MYRSALRRHNRFCLQAVTALSRKTNKYTSIQQSQRWRSPTAADTVCYTWLAWYTLFLALYFCQWNWTFADPISSTGYVFRPQTGWILEPALPLIRDNQGFCQNFENPNYVLHQRLLYQILRHKVTHQGKWWRQWASVNSARNNADKHKKRDAMSEEL